MDFASNPHQASVTLLAFLASTGLQHNAADPTRDAAEVTHGHRARILGCVWGSPSRPAPAKLGKGRLCGPESHWRTIGILTGDEQHWRWSASTVEAEPRVLPNRSHILIREAI